METIIKDILYHIITWATLCICLESGPKESGQPTCICLEWICLVQIYLTHLCIQHAQNSRKLSSSLSILENHVTKLPHIQILTENWKGMLLLFDDLLH